LLLLLLFGFLGIVMTDGTACGSADFAMPNHVTGNAADDGAGDAAGLGAGGGTEKGQDSNGGKRHSH
jgi:hypothetical protein